MSLKENRLVEERDKSILGRGSSSWSGDNWQWLEWYQSMYNICSVIEQGCFQRGKAALQHKEDWEITWAQSILLGIGGNPEIS